ncbi:Kelch-like protein 2 [Actinomortierella ambigua]|uniref:Kelch-like protein 2 n=1 Tax=Actinomortierella ambigua TaxID=1343610 RepID=A0A9P6U5H2_9FUNG|nr:Kelch-like protein 2 [Actinomortierella ambigua]
MEVSYPELLQSQLGNLMKTESAPDVIFLLGKNKVVRRGHSTILKVRSGFFASALRTNCWKETAHDYKFVKENIEPSTFDILLEYMYTGKIIISMENLSSVVNAAAELQLAEFFPACETYACKELGSKSVFDMITLAYLHRLDTLWLTAMEYFDAHAESLLKEEGLLSLSEDLVLEVLSRDCVNVGELDIWRAVVRYVYHKCGLDYHECPLLKIPSWPGRLWVEIIKDQQTGHDRPTGGDMEKEEAKEDFVRQRDDKSQDLVVAIPQSTLQSLRGTILPLLPAVRFSGIRINDFGRLIQGTRLLPHDLCIQVYEYHALAPMISASKDDAVRYGHSQILAARSSYFDRALQPSWREASDGVFRKPNIEPRVFDLLLDYIYTDNIAVSMDIVSQLTDAAVELGLEDLVEGCVEYACNHFNDESVCEMIALSYRHRLERLWILCTEYFDTCGYAILKGDSFLQFDEDLFSIILSREIYSDELTIWGAVVRYSCHKVGLDLKDYPLLTYPKWPGRLLVNTTKTVKQEMFSPDNDDVGASSDEDSEIDPVETKSSDIVVTVPRDHFQLLRAAIKTFLPVIRLTNVPIKDFVRCIEGTGFVSSTFCLGLYRYYALPEKYSSDYAFAPPRAVFSSFLPSEQWRALWSWVLQAMGRPPSSG